MKDLIFIGGAKGIGKSTIIDLLMNQVKINVINTGELVFEARKLNQDVESRISDYLMGDFKGIVDTHYAGGLYNKSFPRGLSKDNLLKIAKHKSIDLILLETDEEILINRRKLGKPERYHDPEVIHLELEMSRIYFKQYCNELSISGLIINNLYPEKTVSDIMRRIK